MKKTIAFLKRRFSDYYRNTDLYLPERFGKREWGFMFFGEGYMQRHLAFQSRDALRQFLVRKAPAHVYHSSAYYSTPNASTMGDKSWLGADLIFDLDADHIKGAENMTYEETLARVKVEFRRLIEDFLLSDLGFDEKQLVIVFSGGRGYHIHIRDPKILTLTSHERREIVDYITGKDLDMDWIFPKQAYDKIQYGPHVKVKHRINMPEERSGGWKRKMREGIMNLTHDLESMETEEALKRLRAFEGIGKKTAEGIYSDLFEGEPGMRGIDRMRDEGKLDIFSDDRHLNPFIDIIRGEKSVRLGGEKGKGIDLEDIEILSVKDRLEGETDEPVTSDIKRLIRLPSSLHGKTGLRVMHLTLDQLKDFQPLRDAVSGEFSDEPVKIQVKRAVEVNLRGERFHIEEGTAEVPEYAAVFLFCRRNAVLYGENTG